jgi:hypothetical protein
LTEGISGNFILIMGTMLVGGMIVLTGIGYLFGRGAPISAILVVIAVGIGVIIASALLARHYL